MACCNKSEYLLSLEAENADIAIRYKEKIRVIQNIDPFTLVGRTPDDSQEICSFPPVDAFHIVSYLVLTHSFYTNDQMKAYKSLAAYKYFEAGFVQDCQAYKIGEHIVVLGQVKHSQRMNNPPLKVWIIFQSDGSVISAHCTCMAGHSEVCSHIGAVLYGLEFMYQAARNLSPTEVKAKWIVPSTSNVPLVKVSDVELKKKSHKKPSTSKFMSNDKIPAVEGDELVKFLQEIKDSGDEAALMRIVEAFASEMNTDVQIELPNLYDVYKVEYESLSYEELCKLAVQNENKIRQEINIDLCKKILVETRNQSKSVVWFKQRSGRITASNFKRACITPISKPSLSLIKNICYPVSMLFKTKATEWGLLHEKIALKEFEDSIKEKHSHFNMIETGLHIDHDYPYLGASPDAMVSCECCGHFCVEVKCPYTLKDMSLLDYIEQKNSCLVYDQNDKDKVLLKSDHCYYYQVQMQIRITKSKFGYFVIWSPEDMFILKVPANDDFCDYDFAKVHEFHQKVILPELLGRYFTKGKHLKQNWCLCNSIDDGRPMIKCDNEECDMQWFHLNCVGLPDVPMVPWFCQDCLV